MVIMLSHELVNGGGGALTGIIRQGPFFIGPARCQNDTARGSERSQAAQIWLVVSGLLTAIHGDHLPGDEPGLWACQKSDHGGDVV
ncbi:hypothetical protein IMCC21224_113363 [Puniceibacterium sp. IMCC21224]|nr:hypothetical protein IMCC21224_113363 [Puniceibacterium sp. IMCC21224]